MSSMLNNELIVELIVKTPHAFCFPPAFKRWAWHGGVVTTLMIASVNFVAAVDNIDDEDFNAISNCLHDPSAVNDMRLGYTMLPAGAKVSLLDRTNGADPVNYSKDTNWDLTGRTGVIWMTQWSGLHDDGDFILGMEVRTNLLVIENKPNSPEIDFRTYQLNIHPGVG